MINITEEQIEEFEKKSKYYDYQINKCTKDLAREYKNTTIDSVSGSTRTIPYMKTSMKIEGRDEVRIRQLNKRKKSFQKRREKLYKDFRYKINKLSEEDPIMANIIEKRVLEKKDFKEIALDMGYAGESSARNAYNRYLEKNKLVRSCAK